MRLGRRVQSLQDTGQNVEIARLGDAPPRRVDDFERLMGGRADEHKEQARESGGAFQRLAHVVDAFRLVAAGTRELIRRGQDRRDERGAAMQGPGTSRGGHGGGRPTPRARSRRANFCTLPVEVFGISAKTTWRGHL